MSNTNLSEALVKIAEGLEKVASSIDAEIEKTEQLDKEAAYRSNMDFGTIGKEVVRGGNPLTDFLLR